MDRAALVDALRFVRDTAEDAFRSIPEDMEDVPDHDLTVVRAGLEHMMASMEWLLSGPLWTEPPQGVR